MFLRRVARVQHDTREMRHVLKIRHLTLESPAVSQRHLVPSARNGGLASHLLLLAPVDGVRFKRVAEVFTHKILRIVLCPDLKGTQSKGALEVYSFQSYNHNKYPAPRPSLRDTLSRRAREKLPFIAYMRVRGMLIVKRDCTCPYLT